MSNPAVIVLASGRGAQSIRHLAVEDNVGEAIHVHADGLRLSMTVDGYLGFADEVRRVLRTLLALRGLDIDRLDPGFMLDIAHMLPRLRTARLRRMRLSELRCAVYMPRLMPLHRIVPLEASPAYAFAAGRPEAYERYSRLSGHKLGDLARIEALVASIERDGFDDSARPLVILNGRPVIADGQHRAAIALARLGDREVQVLDLGFARRRGPPEFLVRLARRLHARFRKAARHHGGRLLARLRLLAINFRHPAG